jgi:hypothetical protein
MTLYCLVFNVTTRLMKVNTKNKWLWLGANNKLRGIFYRG